MSETCKTYDEPAFPVSTGYDAGDGYGHQTGNKLFQFAGLTKREYFAAMAMQGMMANPDMSKLLREGEFFTDLAVEQADGLIKALNEESFPIPPTSRPSDAELIYWAEAHGYEFEHKEYGEWLVQIDLRNLSLGWGTLPVLTSEARAIIEPEYLKWKQEQGK